VFTRRLWWRRAHGVAPDRAGILADFEGRAGVRFKNLAFLEEALTHRSFSAKLPEGRSRSNQRLEFLGDTVLGLVVSEHLYGTHLTWMEGDLTKRKSILVSKNVLAERARALDLGRYLRLSEEELESGGQDRDSALADALEAVIGALYVDGGLDASRRFVRRQILAPLGTVDVTNEHPNYKSELQERVQARYRIHPRYRVTKTVGPDHEKTFTVEVTVAKEVMGLGTGQTKKDAEQMAARQALEKLPGDDHS